MGLDGGLINPFADRYHLCVAFCTFGPVGIVDRETFAAQVEQMPALTLPEPEHPLGAEHGCGQLLIEEMLEAAQFKRSLHGQAHGAESLQLRGMGMVVMLVTITVVVAMAVIVVMLMVLRLAAMVVMAVLVVMVGMINSVPLGLIFQAQRVFPGLFLGLQVGQPVAFKQAHTQQ